MRIIVDMNRGKYAKKIAVKIATRYYKWKFSLRIVGEESNERFSNKKLNQFNWIKINDLLHNGNTALMYLIVF